MGVDKAYFVVGDTAYDYDVNNDATTGDAWKPAEAWSGMPPEFADGIDAAVDLGASVLYVFRDTEYVAIPFATQAVDEGYPKPIKDDDLWRGLSFDAVDAAMNWGDGKVYFFRGPDYVRYDIAARSQDPGYPQPIGGGRWAGVSADWIGDGIDAAINPGTGRAYFFKGTEYVAIDWQSKSQPDGYPLSIADEWSGLSGPFDGAWTNAAPAPSGPTPTPSPSGSEGAADFYNSYHDYAQSSQDSTGVPALVTLGQAALESGWGKHAPGNNFFGIKAKESDPPESRQLLATTEVFKQPQGAFPADRTISITPRPDGKYDYRVRDWFRVYASPADAFAEHGRFLRDNARYAAAFDHTDDPYAFAKAIADAGYATAPNYYDALAARMRQIDASHS